MNVTDRITAEISAVREEHGRADTKASVLLTASGIAVSVLTAGRLPGLAGILAAAAWAVSGAVALAVVTPRLVRASRTGFPTYATVDAHSIIQLLTPGHANGRTDDELAGQLVGMSRLAVSKYRLVQVSAGVAAAALTLTALALALT